MNPATVLRLKKDWDRFTKRHPKLMRYLGVVSRSYLREGVIVELAVREADGVPLRANFRLTQEDIALLITVRELLQKEE